VVDVRNDREVADILDGSGRHGAADNTDCAMRQEAKARSISWIGVFP
jgi:hypothetical protein